MHLLIPSSIFLPLSTHLPSGNHQSVLCICQSVSVLFVPLFYFEIPHISEAIQHLLFSVWLISLSLRPTGGDFLNCFQILWYSTCQKGRSIPTPFEPKLYSSIRRILKWQSGSFLLLHLHIHSGNWPLCPEDVHTARSCRLQVFCFTVASEVLVSSQHQPANT